TTNQSGNIQIDAGTAIVDCEEVSDCPGQVEVAADLGSRRPGRDRRIGRRSQDQLAAARRLDQAVRHAQRTHSQGARRHAHENGRVVAAVADGERANRVRMRVHIEQAGAVDRYGGAVADLVIGAELYRVGSRTRAVADDEGA